ncbi:hypothetical protein SGGMMB4_00348 [Sodalis glossinidius str. 'morsitans']|uniref:Uncharacterized protein n=1 Tax=Sodalis glossinidius (strain morsitans) TaxID=343509 RepID=A0A193QF45_SODGM|nr:hypothetical protein SGGMMB4_00348 [Sodalis glossinidius str. 'morsitans']
MLKWHFPLSLSHRGVFISLLRLRLLMRAKNYPSEGLC